VATAEEALELVRKLSAELARRRPKIKERLAAYRGEEAQLRFASPEFGAYFAERYTEFCDNWCAPVIAATTERMNYQGIRLEGELQSDKDLARVWKANNGERGSSQAFVVMLAASRMFALVWGNPADDETPRITWEHPENCVVSYDPDTGQAVAGLKLWNDGSYEYATLYLPDEVFKFQRRTGAGSWANLVIVGTYVGGWEQRQPAGDDTWPLPNPIGEVPLVEFRNQDLLDDKPISDIDGVAAMQSAINLVWAYLLNGLDYATLPQRVVTGAEMPKVPVLDATGQVVGSRPADLNLLAADRLLWIPSKDAKASEWSAANLQAFDATLDRAVNHVSAQTRTPPHYLVGKIANLSADALTASETGQVAKSGERLTYATPALRQLNRLILLAQGGDQAEARARACAAGAIDWKDIQFRSLAQKADAYGKLKDIGFPFEWIAEQWGLDPEELARVLKMREREAEQNPLMDVARGLADTRVAPAENVPVPTGER
jgi:hypothetical protein